MIREEIKTIIVESVETGLVITEELVEKILSLITTEIEKVELPKYKKSWTSDGEKFEDCLAPVTPEDTRQTILSLLRKQ